MCTLSDPLLQVSTHSRPGDVIMDLTPERDASFSRDWKYLDDILDGTPAASLLEQNGIRGEWSGEMSSHSLHNSVFLMAPRWGRALLKNTYKTLVQTVHTSSHLSADTQREHPAPGLRPALRLARGATASEVHSRKRDKLFSRLGLPRAF